MSNDIFMKMKNKGLKEVSLQFTTIIFVAIVYTVLNKVAPSFIFNTMAIALKWFMIASSSYIQLLISLRIYSYIT